MDKLITTKQVQERFGLPATSLDKWRSLGVGPLYRKIKGRVYYRIADIKNWIERVQVLGPV